MSKKFRITNKQMERIYNNFRTMEGINRCLSEAVSVEKRKTLYLKILLSVTATLLFTCALYIILNNIGG